MTKTHPTRKPTITTLSPRVLALQVPGIGDPNACQTFEATMRRALASKPSVIVVDLSEADSVSTVMLGLLLKLRRDARSIEAEVRLADVQPMVRRVLNICRLDQLFGVFSSVEAAM